MTEDQLEQETLGWLCEQGYPPDQQEEAAQLVLMQAETLCEAWM